jgi:hypothetical protein
MRDRLPPDEGHIIFARGMEARRVETRNPGTGSKGLGLRQPGPAQSDARLPSPAWRRAMFRDTQRRWSIPLAQPPDLVSAAAECLSLDERNLVVVFGSSAIVLRGVPLGREINDLDLFVSDATFAKFAVRFDVKMKSGRDGPVPYMNPCEGVEILKSFPGVEFEDVMARASSTENSKDFLVGALDDVILWKRAQGREKDLDDVKAIERYVQALSGQGANRG